MFSTAYRRNSLHNGASIQCSGCLKLATSPLSSDDFCDTSIGMAAHSHCALFRYAGLPSQCLTCLAKDDIAAFGRAITSEGDMTCNLICNITRAVCVWVGGGEGGRAHNTVQ